MMSVGEELNSRLQRTLGLLLLSSKHLLSPKPWFTCVPRFPNLGSLHLRRKEST